MILYFVGFPCFVFSTCTGIQHELFSDEETGRAVARLEGYYIALCFQKSAAVPLRLAENVQGLLVCCRLSKILSLIPQSCTDCETIS